MERTRVTMVMVCLVVLVMTFVTGKPKASCPNLIKVSKQLWDKDTSQRLTHKDIQVNVSSAGERDSALELLWETYGHYAMQEHGVRKLQDLWWDILLHPDGTSVWSDGRSCYICSIALLFQNVNPAKITSQTYKKFQALLEMYHPDNWTETQFTDRKVQANDEFLDAILNTTVMKRLLEHLKCEEKVTDSSDLKNKLTTAWFVIDPSTSDFGFRHVMEGIYDGNKLFKGLHNWFSLYLKENNHEIRNYRDVKIPQRGVIRANFNWNGRSKDEGSSFFLGVSPEFDMAIYSLCYFMKPDKVCPISVNERDMNIKTYVTHGHIETAYVTFN